MFRRVGSIRAADPLTASEKYKHNHRVKDFVVSAKKHIPPVHASQPFIIFSKYEKNDAVFFRREKMIQKEIRESLSL